MSAATAGRGPGLDLARSSLDTLVGDGGLGRALLRPVNLDLAREAPQSFYQAIDAYIDEQLDGREQVNDPAWGNQPTSVAAYKQRHRNDPRRRADSWLERDEAGRVGIKQRVFEISAELSARANAIAPPFVSARYAIVVTPQSPDMWRALGARRTTVELHPVAADRSEAFDLDLSALGIATWVRLAIVEALRELREEQPRARERAEVPTVYLFDEPEAHLHPLAQRDAAAWIAERSADNVHFVIATHSLAFLQLPLADVEYLQVSRDGDRQTITTRITDDVVGALRETAADAGIPPAAILQLARGWLIVEGEHDRLIIEHFFGHDLRRAGIWVLPLRGASRLQPSFMNLNVLADFHLPFFVLLDNARAGAIERGEIPEQEQTEEEKIVGQLVRLRTTVPDLHALGLPYQDVVRTLEFPRFGGQGLIRRLALLR